MRVKSMIVCGVLLGVVLAVAPVFAEDVGRTPPRLSFVDGQVSFLRPGASDWAEARVNIPLAPGDELYTGSPGNFELQIGARSFVRGWADTQLGLQNHDPDFLQFKVTAGYAAFDLRDLSPGNTVEVDTPNAAFTIKHPGYYRANVDQDRTTFITRRGGSAVATPLGGKSIAIAPSEEVVFYGTTKPEISSYAAPPPDVWDQWNEERSADLIEAVSARYVSPDAYGMDDLDRHGTWRVVPTYGSVWIPNGVPAGWVPYSDGYWIMDPYYGWSWVDRAAWGWAPYHYGRWVHVHGYWAWAPGPVVARPVYAPALVAFVGGPGVSFGISFGSSPTVGWVALGWGEPCVPWWGRPGFIHRPWWGGWYGPRVVNDVVIHHRHVVQVDHIRHYHHMRHGRGVMAVQEQHFGRGSVRPVRVERTDAGHLKLHHTVSRGHATAASYAPFERRGQRPPRENFSRPIVATRQPYVQARPEPHLTRDGRDRSMAPTRIVASPQKGREPAGLKRPSFGQDGEERPSRQRISSTPPAVERQVRREAEIKEPSGRPESPPGADRTSGADRLPDAVQRPHDQARPGAALPGRPANTLSPYSHERTLQRPGQPTRSVPERSLQNAPAEGSTGRGAVRQQPERQPRVAPGGGAPAEMHGQRVFQAPGGQEQRQMNRSSSGSHVQPNSRPGRQSGGAR